MNLDQRLDCIFAAVRKELHSAREKHGPMASPHEGYAVILEELDELWAEIKRKEQDAYAVRDEAVQVAAMAVRFLLDVRGEE